MSKSYKKPIVKDKGLKDIYNKKVRRTQMTSLAKIKFLSEDELEDFEVETLEEEHFSPSFIDYGKWDEKDELRIKASRK